MIILKALRFEKQILIEVMYFILGSARIIKIVIGM